MNSVKHVGKGERSLNPITSQSLKSIYSVGTLNPALMNSVDSNQLTNLTLNN